MEIPGAGRGAQRLETVGPKPKKCKATAKTKGKAKAKKLSLKRPAAQLSRDIEGPASLVRRENTTEAKPLKEAYLLDCKGKYIIGQSVRASADYMTNIEAVQATINNGIVKTTDAARIFLQELG